MRILQNGLLFVGAAALGLVVGGLALTFLMMLTIGRTRPGQDPSLNWGAAMAFPCCAGSGGLIGALAGITLAKRWLDTSSGNPWPRAVWFGAVAGVTLAGLSHWGGLLDRFGVIGDVLKSWPGFICFLAATGMLGGVAGGLVASVPNEVRRPVSRKRKGKRRSKSEPRT